MRLKLTHNDFTTEIIDCLEFNFCIYSKNLCYLVYGDDGRLVKKYKRLGALDSLSMD